MTSRTDVTDVFVAVLQALQGQRFPSRHIIRSPTTQDFISYPANENTVLVGSSQEGGRSVRRRHIKPPLQQTGYGWRFSVEEPHSTQRYGFSSARGNWSYGSERGSWWRQKVRVQSRWTSRHQGPGERVATSSDLRYIMLPLCMQSYT